MRISTKGHYGLRSLVDIALNQEQGPVTLNGIAERQEVSVKYLWQVINPLHVNGYLKVTRGAKGGYMLARAPEQINMLDILTTLEGPVSIIKCLTDETFCTRVRTCISRSVWMEVNRTIEQALAEITLKRILDDNRKNDPSLSFAI